MLHHDQTALAVGVERLFMKTLEGGCTAPIGALATIENQEISFKGILSALDGTQEIIVEDRVSFDQGIELGRRSAKKVLENGGVLLMQEIKKEMKS